MVNDDLHCSDMPPLVYVGENAEFNFREGDRVIISGLKRADLNRRIGSILKFSDQMFDRLPIRIDGADEAVSIKAINLQHASETRASAWLSNSTQEQPHESEDDMPPLVSVATAKPTARAQEAELTSADDSSDDEMPPLEHVGRVVATPNANVVPPLGSISKATGKDNCDASRVRKVAASATQGEISSSDEMPPLEVIGKAAAPAKQVNESSDDDMPPLEIIGKATPIAAPARASSDDEFPALEPPLESIGEASAAATQDIGSSDDEMPPLETIGTAAVTATQTISSSDDEMPPLEFVGKAAPSTTQQNGASNDEMPPLENIGKSVPTVKTDGRKNAGVSPLERDSETIASQRIKGASVCKSPADSKDVLSGYSEDKYADMPPLEYVGKDSSSDFCFREGAMVILKGLSASSLNGQEGVVMPFLNKPEGRVPVALVGSERKMLIKPCNLVQQPEIQTNSSASDDDDMPPLTGVCTSGSRETPASTRPTDTGATTAACEESDNGMPPLEYVGASPAAPSRNEVSKPPANSPLKPTEESDDDMPPLEYAGVKANSTLKPKEESDDEMPPLEFVGVSAASSSELGQRGKFSKPSPNSTSKSAEKSDENVLALEYVGANAAAPSKPPAKSTSKKTEESDDEMPPLGYVGANAGPSHQNANFTSKPSEESGDDMPPLEYVGMSGAPLKPPVNSILKPMQGSDDDMPPLEYVGAGAAAPSKPPAKSTSKTTEESDDEMPPLGYVGATAEPSQQPANLTLKPSEESDDDMPPLEYVGVSGAPSKPPANSTLKPMEGSDDDMPPLEYVGVSAAAPSKPRVNSVSKPTGESDDDMPPLLYVGGRASPAEPDSRGDVSKPSANSTAKPMEESDNDMPPLEYVGASAASPSKLAVNSTSTPVEESEDDMPPLEYVGSSAASPSIPAAGGEVSIPHANFTVKPTEDSEDDMPSLEYVGSSASTSKPVLPTNVAKVSKAIAEPPPQRAHPGTTVKPQDADESDNDTPPLQYGGTTAPKSAAPVANATPDDSDDDMPPLVCSSCKQTPLQPPHESAAGAGSDDEMPPLTDANAKTAVDSKPSSAANSVAFNVGDQVLLHSLPAPSFNGHVGIVRPGVFPAESVQVQLCTSGKLILVKPENLRRVAPRCAGGENLDLFSPQARFAFGDIVLLKDLKAGDVNGQKAKVIKATPRSERNVPVKLLNGGKRLSVKWENLEIVPPEVMVREARSEVVLDSKALLERMQFGLQPYSTLEEVNEVLETVDGHPSVDWGDNLKKKKAMLKKLRLKKRKLEEPGSCVGAALEPATARADDAAMTVQQESVQPAATQKPGRIKPEPAARRPSTPASSIPPSSVAASSLSPNESVSDAVSPARAPASSVRDKSQNQPESPAEYRSAHSEQEWIVLGSGNESSRSDGLATTEPNESKPEEPGEGLTAISISRSKTELWCEENRLPAELIAMFKEEDISEPEDLAGIPEKDLQAFAAGMKLGPKGRFMIAVQKMRASLRAEFGSVYCPSEL